MSTIHSLIDILICEAETNNEMDNRTRLASAKKALLDAISAACKACANKDALIRDLAKQLDGVVPRAKGCKCHLEIGDSPCPVHGEHEEPCPERDSLRAEVARLTAALAVAEREAAEAYGYAQMWRDLDVTPSDVHKAYTERTALRAEVGRLKAAMGRAYLNLCCGLVWCCDHSGREASEEQIERAVTAACEEMTSHQSIVRELRAERDQLRALVQAVAHSEEELIAYLEEHGEADISADFGVAAGWLKRSEEHKTAINACTEEAKRWEK